MFSLGNKIYLQEHIFKIKVIKTQHKIHIVHFHCTTTLEV